MDHTLTLVPAAVVKRTIARAWLDRRAVNPRLGEIVLAPHQIDAVARLSRILDDVGGALLADEPGLGKTFVALAVAREYSSLAVVAPAALREMWAHSMARTGRIGLFVSFEALSREPTRLREVADLVVIDEAHHARNPRARRYPALARLTWGARVLLLTATPVHNRPRELRALLALFLGAQASTLGDAELARLIVRRRDAQRGVQHAPLLPAVEPAQWLGIDAAPGVLRAIQALPPAVPTADGGRADALLHLGLMRAWCSSNAALRAALRRRLMSGTALLDALASGRWPTRRELSAWVMVDDALQLAFPELVATPTTPGVDARALTDAVLAHCDGVRHVLRAVDEAGDADAVRVEHLRRLRGTHGDVGLVAFTQFAETARGLGDRMRGDAGVAVVTARGGRIASGPVPREEILAAFGQYVEDRRLRLDLLLATDALSEGLNLQRAGVVVHLDLPWTTARLEQRLGRVRRIGSRHASINVYAIGPPVNGRELAAVTRALQRKARIVQGLVGGSELSIDGELLGARVRRLQRGAPNDNLASVSERLRDFLVSWVDAASGTDDEGVAQRAVSGRVAVLRAAETTRGGVHNWDALALCCALDRLRVVATSREAVSEHPRAILDVARAVGEAIPIPPTADNQCSKSAVLEARALIESWLAHGRGRALAEPVLASPSDEHRHTLRWLDQLVSHASRHERGNVAELAASCRARVLSARGAGAELAMAEWRHGLPTELPHGDSAVACLEQLATVLAPRSPLSVASRTSQTALVALLVLVYQPSAE